MTNKQISKQKMPSKPNFDPREMMEKAVEVMRQSVPEHRADDSPSPLVGAVLVRPDGSIETATRVNCERAITLSSYSSSGNV